MSKKLKLTDKINFGENKKVVVSEIVNKKGEIFKLIKEGYEFDDEVLEKARIKKTIRDVKIISKIVNTKKTDKKIYPKETENIKTILKEINILEDIPNNDNLIEEENDKDYFVN